MAPARPLNSFSSGLIVLDSLREPFLTLSKAFEVSMTTIANLTYLKLSLDLNYLELNYGRGTP